MKKTKTCCRYFQKCVGRKCKKSNRTCKVVQHLTRQKRKGCYWKRFKRGRRQRCCSYHVFCKFDKKSHKKFCRRLFKKCKWVGPTIYWTSKLSCKWKRKAKNQRQKRCCKKVSKCRGKECKQMKLTCEWRGAVISRHTKKRCRWVDDHKVGKKKYCCKKIRSCGSKKCKILSKKCGFTGETIQFKTEAKCSWAKFTGYKQRKCCYKRIRCKNHKNCRTIRSKCKYLGSKVTQHQFHTCKRLKEAMGLEKDVAHT